MGDVVATALGGRSIASNKPAVNQQMKMPSYVILLSIDGIDGCPPFLFQASFSIAIPTYYLSMFSFCLLSLFSSCRSTIWPLKFA